MSRTLEVRLRKLESRHPAGASRWHRIIGDTNEELAEKQADLKASPEWQEGDNLIAIRIVDPPQRTPA